MSRIRVLLLIPHLGGGGAEQVAALLARGLSREKYDLHLGLVTGEAGLSATRPGDPTSGLAVHELDAPRVRAGALRLLRLVWRLRPAVILSGMFHLNFLVLLLKPFFPSGTQVLVRQNGTVSAALAAGGLPRGTRFLYRVLYRRAHRVICSSRAMADDLVATIDLPPELPVVLSNPLDLEAILAARHTPVRWPGPGPHLLAVGRLAPEKGFDLLLEAFAKVRDRFPAADLTIAGAGPEEGALRAECRRLSIEHAVSFPGHVENPYAFFPGATLFVLPSRHEGMPNALLEALAGGLPAVAFPASGGIIELLQARPAACLVTWPASWIVPEISAAALAETLVSALESLPSARQHHTAVPAAHGFSPAIAAYEELIDRTCAARGA